MVANEATALSGRSLTGRIRLPAYHREVAEVNESDKVTKRVSSNHTLWRATPVDLEIRGSDGRTVSGIAAPYDSPTQISEMVDGSVRSFTEVFTQGQFARSIEERGDRVKFMALHDHKTRMPLGRATLLREDTVGLYGEFRVSKTREGDEALELIRDGSLDGLSVGFSIVRDLWSKPRDHRTVLEAKLFEVSAVPFPAFSNAKILAVRDDGSRPIIPRAQARLRLLEMESHS